MKLTKRSDYSSFYNMADVIPEGQIGTAKIEHFTVGLDSNYRAVMHPNEYIRPGRYCRLMVAGSGVVMSDTDHEQRTNIGMVAFSKGRILIGGLGIGLIVLPLLEKPEVASVLVVEKNPDVVALVEPAIRKAAGEHAGKLTVVLGDVYTWKPAKGDRFDSIYFDIWSDVSTDVLVDMAKLHQRAKTWKAPNGRMDCWQREYLKYRLRQEKARGW